MCEIQSVKILNPRPGQDTHTTHGLAKRYVRRGLARFDICGRLEFLYDPAVKARAMRSGPLALVEVRHFDGADAFPERAVLPPSGEVLAKLLSRHARFIPAHEVIRQRGALNRQAMAAGAR